MPSLISLPAGINFGRLLALTNMTLAAISSVGYLLVGDYRKAIYWAAAAVITGSVTL